MEWLSSLQEPRKRRARIPLHTMAVCAFLLVSSRLGSLNALEKCRRGKLWRQIGVKGRLPSADQLGRVCATLAPREVRRHMCTIYRRQKRRKALSPAVAGNLFALVVDGHESSASYLRCCDDCLTRRINKDTPRERVQYYHRLVMGVLVCKGYAMLLDVELQRKGENEVACAMRLLERLLADYPRAFDLVVADGLYAQAPFFKKVRAAGKHIIAVLKNEERCLAGDAEALCKCTAPRWLNSSRTKRQVWDIEHLESWPQVGMPVRVVRSVETTTVQRQNGGLEKLTTHWMWVSSIPRGYLATKQFVEVAHDRWDIENRAFNELVTYWHADHVYRHDANAILVFWLMTMVAYNIYHAFFFGNIKPQLRERLGKYRIADALRAELIAQDLPHALSDP